jgi:cytochrome c oxidase subunit III
MSVTDVQPESASAHGDHEHPEWLAHHFDDAEQQFDSGKLGMWLFLVTEVLFFSGMFCAYALLRSMNPEVFAYASQFLNSTLGAINTGVLLFSSLTMAWAVRCAILGQHRLLVAMLAMTLSCASMFLGVKAVEYSHKWDLGLLPGALYRPQGLEAEHHEGLSPYLIYLSLLPAACVVGFGAWYAVAAAGRKAFQLQVAGPFVTAAACFFVGVALGSYLESGGEHGGDGHASHHADGDYAHHGHEHDHDHADAVPAATSDAAAVAAATGFPDVKLVSPRQAFPGEVAVPAREGRVPDYEVNQSGRAGLFFSVYYCMTGIHAIHILAGMLVIGWLIIKAARHEFHANYFGPVDNVGLYWHLVDFIWIYLFPLLYLI